MGTKKDDEGGAMLDGAQTGDEGHDTPTGNDSQGGNGGAGGDSSQLSLDGIAATHAQAHEGFDPDVHAVNEDGTPKKKADGSFAKKRGRKSGAAASALPPKAVSPLASVGEPVKISADEAARQSANLVINAAVWTLGAEVGQPRDKAEAEGLKLSFKNYFEARGVPNIPPEIGLFIAVGSYIGPRLYSEVGKTKMEKLTIWFKAKLWAARNG
jgi:hypothetical protein